MYYISRWLKGRRFGILRRRILGAALTCALLMGAFCLPVSASAGEFGSNRYTQALSQAGPLEGYDLEGYTLLLENDTLALYWRREVGGLRVEDKRSGYVWGTMAGDKPENLNQRWSAIANSMAVIDVFDGDGKGYKAGIAGEELQCEVYGSQVEVQAWLSDWQIGFTFQIELADNALTFSMEDESIVEEGDFRIANLTFIPFFGAVDGNSLPGYVFVPDGCGALIRFLSPRNYLTGYEKRIYGSDLGIDAINSSYTGAADTAALEQSASLPLFGITHGQGQNAYLAVADSGEEYGTIVADPAGLICDYTRAHIRFVYRQMYEQPVSRVGVGIQTLQPKRNVVNPRITYYFLTGEDAGYAGMARTYRGLLESRDILGTQRLEGEVPLRVDFLAADIRKQFIGASTYTATSKELLEKAGKELQDAGVSRLELGLVGWQKGGLNGYRKTKDADHTVYGALSRLQDVPELVLSLAPFSAREGQLDKRGEGAISLSQELIARKLTDRSGAQEKWLGDVYYLKPQKAAEALERQAAGLAQEGFDTLLVQEMDLLYGEYLDGSETSRSQALELIQSTVEELSGRYEKLILTRPNACLFGSMDGYDQMPMVSSQFLYETDTVPFLQMVLSGRVELYAPYGNLSFYSVSDILKMIDFNTSPTYLLTECDNYALRDTASSELSSTRYEDWMDTAAEVWNQVNQILGKTRGQQLTDRLTPETGVVINCYETGRVYINYNKTERTVEGVLIPAQTAVWREGA